jgi:HlyD family secretion protein
VRVVEVKSNASGELLAVHAESGDLVARGTVLAEVDPRDVANAVAQASADLESARVRLATARAEHDRTTRLVAEGLLPPQEAERTAEGLADAQAAQIRARTTLELATEKSRDVTIRAPIDGTILERGVEPGQIVASATSNVSGGSTLFRMADLTEMEVETMVDEVDIGRIGRGQEARVTFDAYPGRTFEGRVGKIEPQAVVEQNVTRFPVSVRVDNSSGLVRPGMNAEVTLEVAGREGVLAVPSAAVVSVRDVASVAELLGVEAPAGRGGSTAHQASGGEGGATGDGSCRELFQKVRSGGGPEALTDDERAALRACRERLGGAGGRSGGGRRSRGAGGVDGVTAADAARPGFVFVLTLGLSDWEHTEVVEGLVEGEQVVLVTIAQMQSEQREMSERVRQRFGGPLAGGQGGQGGRQGSGRQGSGGQDGRQPGRP